MSDWLQIAGIAVSALCICSIIASPDSSGRASRWRIAVAATFLALVVPLVGFLCYFQGQASVSRQAYVQFYPPEAMSMGPWMGECLRRPEGTFCPQTRD